jgi:protein SCO1
MVRFYLMLVATLFLLTACGSTDGKSYTRQLRGAVLSPARTLEDFSLAATTGDEFTLSEHRGEVLLLYFGYRSCPDFCPNTFAELIRVYTELGEPADKLKIMFVTIDPERDTLDYLGEYVAAFHEDFIGLRAEGATLEGLQAQFGVVAEKREVGESALAYLYDHTASLFLVGPDGELEVQYLYGTSYRDIVHDIRLMLETLE